MASTSYMGRQASACCGTIRDGQIAAGSRAARVRNCAIRCIARRGGDSAKEGAASSVGQLKTNTDERARRAFVFGRWRVDSLLEVCW
jgi:hypothetical protein